MAGDGKVPALELTRTALERFGGGFALFRAVYEGSAITDWEILDANTTMQTRLGHGTAVIGKRISNLLDLHANGEIGVMYLKALDTGERQEATVRVIAPNGASWRRVIVVPLSVDTVATVTTDVGGLAEFEAHSVTLAEHTSDVIVISTMEDGIVWVSSSVERVFGHSAGSLVGSCAAELVHDDDVDAIIECFGTVVSDPSLRQALEIRIRCADDLYRWFSCEVVNRTEDPLVRGLILVLRDVDAKRRSEDALRLSEVRTREMLDATSDAVVTVGEDGTVEQINKAAEALFEVTAADVIGQGWWELATTETVERTRNAVSSSLGSDPAPFETSFTVADGSTRFVSNTISRVTGDGRTTYIAVARDITAQRATEVALEQRARFDELTGLWNRRGIVERLEDAVDAARSDGMSVGVIFMDLDRFQLVNESFGHEAGDTLLKLVATRLQAVAGHGNVARIAGDEFVVVCPNARDEEYVRAHAQLVDQVFEQPFQVGHEPVALTASIGISIWNGRAECATDVMRHADIAMYRAKGRGPGRFEFFDDMMDDSSARLNIESALRFAVNREELRAYYQPVVAIKDGRPTHMEALVRWDRPGMGIVPPGEFIPIAEETGVINAIGAWMLQRATLDCAEWQDAAPGVGVSVNVSARQLDAGDFTNLVEVALQRSGLQPSLLCVEITESLLIDNAESAIATLQALKERGVRLSLDDFGTGYSSLTYLERLPLDELKIDRSFVTALEDERGDRTLIRMMVHLGRSLGLTVVAEGVDSVQKLTAAKQLGCHAAQGYLFAEPAPIEAIRQRFEGPAISGATAGFDTTV
jgi:diguanylate cyclase (GGDEF)-like protein/PAS domain S-box-containing protein